MSGPTLHAALDRIRRVYDEDGMITDRMEKIADICDEALAAEPAMAELSSETETLHAAMVLAATWHLTGAETKDAAEAWSIIGDATLDEMISASRDVSRMSGRKVGGLVELMVTIADRKLCALYTIAHYSSSERGIVVMPEGKHIARVLVAISGQLREVEGKD